MQQAKTNLRVLVVEDDQRTLDLLCRGLRDFGHTAMPVSDGAAGFDLALVFDFDVIVLDVGLPTRDGYEIARTLREMKRSVPVLMLTARDAEDDIIRGLESGADDYLLKPFSFPELVARLQTLCRNALQRAVSPVLLLDLLRLTVTRDNISIPLTRTEFLLLSVLHKRVGNTVPRCELMEVIWGDNQAAKGNALEVLINGLRGKVDGPFPDKVIETVRGVGYRLRANAAIGSGGRAAQSAEGRQILQEWA